jgi:hypothetical protein
VGRVVGDPGGLRGSRCCVVTISVADVLVQPPSSLRWRGRSAGVGCTRPAAMAGRLTATARAVAHRFDGSNRCDLAHRAQGILRRIEYTPLRRMVEDGARFLRQVPVEAVGALCRV